MSKLPGARLIVLDGVAHTTGRHQSACMNAAVTRYFVDGALPEPGTVCKSETRYFDKPVKEEPVGEEEPVEEPPVDWNGWF